MDALPDRDAAAIVDAVRDAGLRAEGHTKKTVESLTRQYRGILEGIARTALDARVDSPFSPEGQAMAAVKAKLLEVLGRHAAVKKHQKPGARGRKGFRPWNIKNEEG